MSIKSSQIRLNVPNKVLGVSVTSVSGVEYWPFANGDSDQWWEGSISPRYYRWEVEFSVTEQEHGSHLTRRPFAYDGLDVVVGDWIAGGSDGRCLKVVAVTSKTVNTVRVIAEDWLRYNTMKAPSGQGAFNAGPAVIFSLNENGYPMLDPLPTNVGTDFYALVTSRFQYLNPQLNFVLEQKNHGFAKGDVIAVTGDGFVKANAQTAASMIGLVTESGPGPDHFIILPNKRIVDIEPQIPGRQGDYIYVDTETGTLSNTAVDGRLIYLCIRGPQPTVLTGNKENPTLTNNYTVTFNGYPITFTTPQIAVLLPQIITQINNYTEQTGIVADAVQLPTVVSSDSEGTAYGLVGGFVPFSAYFNNGSGNQLVNFTTAGSQYPNVATPQDMMVDINAAGIPNLVASATVDTLTLTELNGNSISITNGSPDNTGTGGGGFSFVGLSNVSGLPAFVGASNGESLELRRDDGGEILIYEGSTQFAEKTGITSGHTGSMPLAMHIEQGVRTSGITVVGDIAARNALYPQAGDMVYVVNKGDSEWGMYLYTGSVWEITGTQDSATVDAKTLTATFVLPLTGDTTVKTMGSISAGRKITTVSVEVISAITGYSSTPSVSVGTATDQELFLDENSSDLLDPGVYFGFPEYVYDPEATQELEVEASLSHFGATTGEVIVKVTYV